MAKDGSPEDLLVGILKDTLVAAYTVLVFVATGIIVIGKFVFDSLYALVKAKQERDRAKGVECSASRSS